MTTYLQNLSPNTLTTEEFEHLLDPTDPIQAKMAEIMEDQAALPTESELEDDWASPEAIEEQGDDLNTALGRVRELLVYLQGDDPLTAEQKEKVISDVYSIESAVLDCYFPGQGEEK